MNDLREHIEDAYEVGDMPHVSTLMRRGGGRIRRLTALAVVVGAVVVGAAAVAAVQWGSPAHVDLLADCVSRAGYEVVVDHDLRTLTVVDDADGGLSEAWAECDAEFEESGAVEGYALDLSDYEQSPLTPQARAMLPGDVVDSIVRFGASPYQLAILEDGRVTEAEYQRAMNDTADCLGRRSINARLSDPDARGVVYLVLPASSGQTATVDAAMDECGAEFSLHVAPVYEIAVGATPSLEEFLEYTGTCLRRAGVDAQHPITQGEANAFLAELDDAERDGVMRCVSGLVARSEP